MPTLTTEGRQLVEDLALRHGFSEAAVTNMLIAVTAGQGRMAQFSHPEFGGSGQWMSGGMLMLGDMFNHALKGRVAGLCADLSDALAAHGPLVGSAQTQSQSQGGRAGQAGGALLVTPLFTPSASSSWWPQELGVPSATGSQNTMRYALFVDAHRLALEVDGEVRVYDTLDHRIGGFSQQQGGGAGVSMSSQHGRVDLETLPVVSRNGEPPAQGTAPGLDAASSRSTAATPAPRADKMADPETASAPEPSTGPSVAPLDDPLRLIERLGELRDNGLLSDEEFASKKQELLARL